MPRTDNCAQLGGTDQRGRVGRSRYEEIAESLRQAIRGGVHPPGSRLPSESDLAAEWGASRGTVRQAVALLAS